MNPALLDTTEAAAYLRSEPGTLANWRCSRLQGPPWVKVGARVFYRKSDLDAWLEGQLVHPLPENAVEAAVRI